MMSSKALNNASPNTALSVLVSLDTKGADIDISTAKFSLYGYEALKKQLEAARAIRLLLCTKQIDLLGTDAERAKTLELLQSILARNLFKLLEKKAEIRALPVDNPGSALTIIQNKVSTAGGDLQETNNTALYAGPGYTLDGLGALPSTQNYQGMQFFDETTASFGTMFENSWNGATDIKHSFLDRLHEIYKDRSPREIYEYALYRMFEHDDTGKRLNKDTGIANTKIYHSLYNFQRDAMIGAIEKIEKYNGCILADSVGLGKTFTALAVIKYYLLKNANVLVLAPKKLRENWVQYREDYVTNPFAREFNYKVLNHTDLTRKSGFSDGIDLSKFNWNNFDLIVIDESHNFRTDSSEKETQNTTRYQKLLQAVQSGVKTKILMLTATPVNIKLKDLQSQINFITEKKDDALETAGIDSIKLVIKRSQKDFNQWMKLEDDERTIESFFQYMNPDYFTLLETLTIARSRKLIEHFYDTSDVGKFPTRLDPENITPDSLICGMCDISVESIAAQLDELKLAIYAQLNYVRLDARDKYPDLFNETFSDVGRERTTIKLMRAMFLKRLESHVRSFIESIDRLIAEIKRKIDIIEKVNRLDEYTSNDIAGLTDIQSLTDDDFDDDDLELLNTDELKVDPLDIDIVKWKPDLEFDLNILNEIRASVIAISPENDGKLAELLRIIEDKWEHPLNRIDGRNNKKVLIFTAFSDTAKELYNTLTPKFLKRGIYTGLVTGTYSTSNIELPKEVKARLNPNKFDCVLTHFSPISKNRNAIIHNLITPSTTIKLPEIDVLIATDCVSEGQNLQDCDICINYDIHWNPVRIIQRFGRIDRIGSKNNTIKLVNFWPTKELDAYLKLSQRVKTRVELMDNSAASEGSPLKPSNRSKQSDREFTYRARQLETLRDHVVNPEDIDGSIPLTDINLSEWKTEAMHLMEEAGNHERLSAIPQGICTVAPANHDIPDGSVLFILKAIGGAHVASSLAPYCPILLAPNGEVLASYKSPNKVLAILRDTCGRDGLSKVTNGERDLGGGAKQLHAAADLLRKAIAHIAGIDEEAAAESLFTKGGTTIGTQKAEFEVVCFVLYKKNIKCDESDPPSYKPWPKTPEDSFNNTRITIEEENASNIKTSTTAPEPPTQPNYGQTRPKYTLDMPGDNTNDGHIHLGGK